MVFDYFTKFFRQELRKEAEDDSEISLKKQIHLSAERFSIWLKENSIDEENAIHCVEVAFNLIKSQKGEEFPESLGVDAAAFMGTEFQKRFPGGDWIHHDFYGVALAKPGGVETGVFAPMPLVESYWKFGNPKLTLYFDEVAKRLEIEKAAFNPLIIRENEILKALKDARENKSENETAVILCQRFQEFWLDRHSMELPVSLQGCRILDRFLRENYFLNFHRQETYILAGFYLGEIIRGLFQGEWKLDASDIIRSRIEWPELSYYPVGRIFKMLSEFPIGEPLDEYVRLVPSARKEIRNQQSGKKENDAS